MKKWILLVALFNTSILTFSLAQTNQVSPLKKGIYLVVGSFQNKDNATKFQAKIVSEGRDALVSYSEQTMFYYVYIKTFETVDEAIIMVKPTREGTELKDAWVLAYAPTTGMTAISTIPIKTEAPDSVVQNDGNTSNIVSPAILSSDNKEDSTTLEIAASGPIYVKDFITNRNQYKFIFNAYNFVTQSKVNGNINVIDPDRLKIIRPVKTHEVTYLNDPHNQSNSVEFISDIFGYKKSQHNIDLDDSIKGNLAAFMTVNGDTLTVDFPLKRYDKGEVIVMYNVFFYKDAAIMKPESQFELNSLLELLNEQSDYNIRISGHTNGNAAGRIIEIDNEVPEYFSLSQATKEKNGSAKKLSLRRAEIIQKYLINNGISADRMEVKGWGGKKPLYDKFDRLASKNVRVEIEIFPN